MTNQEILTKAIEKAVKNGWLGLLHPDSLGYLEYGHPFEVIFSKEFAKAFWGETNTDYLLTHKGIEKLPFLVSWQYHLQQQVISDDPIKYLLKGLERQSR